MFNISNNGLITMSRGESASVPLFIDCGNPYHMLRYRIKHHKGIKVYLGVMECNKPFEKAIIKKKYDENSEFTDMGDLLITFDSTDTEFLLPGKYYYSIKMEDGEGKVFTLVPSTEFFITE